MSLLQQIQQLEETAQRVPKLERKVEWLQEQFLYADWMDISELCGKYNVSKSTLHDHLKSRCSFTAKKDEPAMARIKPGTDHKYQIRECYVRDRFKLR